MNSFGVEKATTIRYPSTANLLVDSEDRNTGNYASCFDFQINRPNAIMNGFFSRAGTTEVVLEWCQPNILLGDITLDMSGAAVRSNETITFAQQFMTVADVLNAILDLSGDNGVGLTLSESNGYWGIDATGGQIRVISTPLAVALGLNISANLSTRVILNGCPDLRRYRYIDFTSSQLTYAQDLKDASTAPIVRDVLCRWYFAEDYQESRDEYGFPILQGYEPFVRRRLFNPPKQIKWDNNLPVGNLGFQVFDDDGNLLPSSSASSWLMTLQLSEN